MRKLIFIIGAAVTVVIGWYLFSGERNAMATYHELKKISDGKVLSYGGFIVSVPNDWKDQTKVHGEVVLADQHADALTGYRPNLVIMQYEAEKYPLDEAARQSLEENRKSLGSSFKLLTDERTTFLGKEAIRRTHEFDYGSYPLRQLQIYFIDKAILYEVTATHIRNEFDAYMPTFEKIIATMDTEPLTVDDPTIRLLNLVIDGQNELYAIGVTQNPSLLAVFAQNDRRNVDIAIMAIEEGADVNIAANFGESPLMWASGKGYADVVKKLLEKGADVNTRSATGRTALWDAVSTGRADILKALLGSGRVTKEYLNFSQDNGKTETLLMKAAEVGDVDMVRMLVEAGAQAAIQDDSGNDALARAARSANREVVEYLLGQDGEPNKLNDDGENTLFSLARWYPYQAENEDQVAFARLLIEHGEDPTIKNIDGKTAAEVARGNNHSALAAFLETVSR